MSDNMEPNNCCVDYAGLDIEDIRNACQRARFRSESVELGCIEVLLGTAFTSSVIFSSFQKDGMSPSIVVVVGAAVWFYAAAVLGILWPVPLLEERGAVGFVVFVAAIVGQRFNGYPVDIVLMFVLLLCWLFLLWFLRYVLLRSVPIRVPPGAIGMQTWIRGHLRDLKAARANDRSDVVRIQLLSKGLWLKKVNGLIIAREGRRGDVDVCAIDDMEIIPESTEQVGSKVCVAYRIGNLSGRGKASTDSLHQLEKWQKGG